MGHLTIISETGMFHSAVLLEFDEITEGSPQQWYGFKPSASKMPIWKGHLDTSNREAFINHYIRFEVPDQSLARASRFIRADYSNAYYVVGVKDCVSLSADAARWCNLRVPDANFTPYGLLLILRNYNLYTEWDVRPYPWRHGH